MTWFIFSLLSIAALASAELLQQHLLTAKNALSVRTSAVFTFLFQSLIIAPIVLLSPLRDQIFSVFDEKVLFKILILSLISIIAHYFYLKSFIVKNISFSTIFISSSVIVSTVLGIIFFNESVRIEKFIGIFLIFSAVVLVNIKNGSLEKNHLLGLIAAACFGVTYTLDKSIVSNIHPLIYILWGFLFISFWGFIASPKDVIRSVKNNKLIAFFPILLSAAAYLLYNAFTFFAYRYGGEVGKVDAINNSQIFLIILFEFFIFRQRDSIYRKILTAIIAFAGVLLLGLVE